jgi:hypothetical protein
MRNGESTRQDARNTSDLLLNMHNVQHRTRKHIPPDRIWAGPGRRPCHGNELAPGCAVAKRRRTLGPAVHELPSDPRNSLVRRARIENFDRALVRLFSRARQADSTPCGAIANRNDWPKGIHRETRGENSNDIRRGCHGFGGRWHCNRRATPRARAGANSRPQCGSGNFRPAHPRRRLRLCREVRGQEEGGRKPPMGCGTSGCARPPTGVSEGARGRRFRNR